MKNRLLKTIGLTVAAVALVLLAGDMIWAQPPGMPNAPDQAPIDGGLGLLAAAGGAYALKKIRNRKG